MVVKNMSFTYCVIFISFVYLVAQNCNDCHAHSFSHGHGHGHADGIEVISLDGNASWTARNENGSVRVPAVVPGSIYTDLQRHGVIGDPYYRYNDLLYRWVAYDNWTYSRLVNVSASFLHHQVVQMVAEGLDTVADVSVNGRVVGRSINMFVGYTFYVKDALKEGENEVTVAFKSAVTYARGRATPYPYDVPEDCPPPAQRGECHFNFVRKQACSFSWDWGPAFPTAGIWKSISLEAYDAAVIRYVTVETLMTKDGTWLVNGSVFFDTTDDDRGIMGTLTVTIVGVRTRQSRLRLSSGRVQHHFSLSITKNTAVRLWWPNGLGRPSLYDLVVTFRSDATQATTKTVRFGFRTVQLVQEPLAPGLSFYFRINNRVVFMKGANWIPADSFQERVTESILRDLLGSAVAANMNVLRVWGGGVYESELFYSLTDQLGLLVWQDFMFACSLYPTDDAFLTTVRQEVVHQVRRLQYHPSIFIWATNNENEEEADRFRNTTMWQRYHYDYVKLYVRVVREVVMQEDPGRPFVMSSPSNGDVTKPSGWISRNPQSLYYGDVHHYDYEADSWAAASFRPPRFASEFGLQSWCSLESLRGVTEPGDWDVDGEMVRDRNHHTDGNIQMMRELKMNLPAPTSSNKTERFLHFIYLSQINQAMGLKTETELYRRSQCDLDERQQGYTMGALYWQLNDIWPAPTWSSLEHSGHWKMLHYYAKRFYRKVLLSPTLDGALIMVHLVNDNVDANPAERKSSTGRRDRFDVSRSGQNLVTKMNVLKTLNVRCYAWSATAVRKEWKIKFIMPDSPSAVITQLKLGVLLTECGCASRQHCVFVFELDSKHDNGSNFLLVSNLKDVVGLQKATLKVADCELIDNQTVSLTIRSDAVALFVWLEAAGWPGHFSDNGFLMVEAEVSVQFHSRSALVDATRFRRSLTISSLSDVHTSSR